MQNACPFHLDRGCKEKLLVVMLVMLGLPTTVLLHMHIRVRIWVVSTYLRRALNLKFRCHLGRDDLLIRLRGRP